MQKEIDSALINFHVKWPENQKFNFEWIKMLAFTRAADSEGLFYK